MSKFYGYHTNNFIDAIEENNLEKAKAFISQGIKLSFSSKERYLIHASRSPEWMDLYLGIFKPDELKKLDRKLVDLFNSVLHKKQAESESDVEKLKIIMKHYPAIIDRISTNPKYFFDTIIHNKPQISRLLQGYYSKEALETPRVGEDSIFLEKAASYGDIKLAKALLERGANIEGKMPKYVPRIEYYGTPLVRSARAGHLDIVKLLLENGADIEGNIHNVISAFSVEERK